jgi:DNA gyrase/topoisomerase IV subunit B
MYIGSLDFFALIHYLVEGVNLLLSRHPTWLEISVEPGGVGVSADVELPLRIDDEQQVFPFECFSGHASPELGAAILAALSEDLTIDAVTHGKAWKLRFHEGKRIELSTQDAPEAQPIARMLATPDPSIFTVTSIPLHNFHSYLRRLSYLHPGVKFRLKVAGQTHEYHSPLGLRDLYHCISAPYQILHEPIHWQASEPGLEMAVVFGFQSWSNDVTMSFINSGRAADGGSHEEGLAAGLADFRQRIGLARRTRNNPAGNGIVALMSIHCPDLLWQGCIKARINMPELKDRIRQQMDQCAEAWLTENPTAVATFQQFRVFHFPESWTAK